MTVSATRRGYLAGLPRNVFLLALASLADIYTQMLYPVLPTFLTQTDDGTVKIPID